MIDTYLSAHVAALADYAVKTGLIECYDRVWAVNGQCRLMKSDCRNSSSLST